jgi:predicted PurR-regulated permease PerM
MSKSWSKTTRYLVLILLLITIVAFAVAAKDLIVPLAISALLAWLLNPAVTLFNNRTKLKRQWAVLIVFLVSLAIIVAIGVALALLAPSQINDIADDVQEIYVIVFQQLEETLSQPVMVMGTELNPQALIDNFSLDTSAMVRPDIVWEWLRATSTNLTWMLVIIVTTFYLLLDWPRLREWLISLGPEAYQSDFRRVYEEVRTVWQRYLRGQLRLSLVIGFLTTLLLAAIGMPGAIVFGILAAIFDVILTVGPVIVAAAAALVAVIAGSTYLPVSNLWFTLLVIGIFVLIQAVENVWLRPRIMGSSLNLHPGVVFIAIVGALSLAGIFAALIVVPVLGSTAVIAHYIHAKIMDIPPWPDVQITSQLPPDEPEPETYSVIREP